jgi:hypothetical protein
MNIKEFIKLKDYVFRKIKISTGAPIEKLVASPDKIPVFITLKAVQAIKILFPNVTVSNYKFHESPAELRPRGVHFASVFTVPESNHPLVVFAMQKDTHIYIVRPYGRAEGHVDINTFESFADRRYLNEMSTIEYYALFLLFEESMRIRKQEIIISDRYSLIDCNNIKQCRLKFDQITKANMSAAEKKKAYDYYNEYYKKKAVVFLLKYFTLLEQQNYKEAFNFLRGKNSDYFGKQRLDTFFIDSKGIVGHLQIFITIYQFMYSIIDRYLESHKTIGQV